MVPVILLLLAVLVTGCTTHVYSWRVPPGSDVRADWAACLDEANSVYVPWVAGSGPQLTIAKDCMEKRGYVKVDRDADAVTRAQ